MIKTTIFIEYATNSTVILLMMLFIALSASAQESTWRYSTMSRDWFRNDTTSSKVSSGILPEWPKKKKKHCTHNYNMCSKDVKSSTAAMQIKSNMLYDAVLAPSGGVEVTLGKKWSVGADGFIAWLRNKESDLWYQYYGFDIYGRYWFDGKHKSAMTGLHLGAYAGTLTYDLYPKNTGYQCRKMFHTYRVGTEIGYAIPIGKTIVLDLYGGLGIFHTRQDLYKSYGKGEYYKTGRRYRNYPDFTRLGISIGYKVGQ